MISAIETLQSKIEVIKETILINKDMSEVVKVEYRKVVQEHEQAIKLLKYISDNN
jgi:hypothetical protein